MVTSPPRWLYHGGVSGMRRGDIIRPGMAEHRYVKGCPHCEAQRAGKSATEVGPLVDPPTPPNWVYATSHRRYGRWYASRAVEGDLYRVRLRGDVEPSTEDPFPTWRGREAVVERILERKITLTMRQRRDLFRRWGGTDQEFDGMLLATRELIDSARESS